MFYKILPFGRVVSSHSTTKGAIHEELLMMKRPRTVDPMWAHARSSSWSSRMYSFYICRLQIAKSLPITDKRINAGPHPPADVLKVFHLIQTKALASPQSVRSLSYCFFHGGLIKKISSWSWEFYNQNRWYTIVYNWSDLSFWCSLRRLHIESGSLDRTTSVHTTTQKAHKYHKLELNSACGCSILVDLDFSSLCLSNLVFSISHCGAYLWLPVTLFESTSLLLYNAEVPWSSSQSERDPLPRQRPWPEKHRPTSAIWLPKHKLKWLWNCSTTGLRPSSICSLDARQGLI